MSARISGRAQADLDLIYARIYADRGVRVADQFLERAQRAIAFIAQNLLAGPHSNWATRHRTLRFWNTSGTRFAIYYIPDEEGVSIERVLTGAGTSFPLWNPVLKNSGPKSSSSDLSQHSSSRRERLL
jgi:plasmid stabilization system protein ParE